MEKNEESWHKEIKKKTNKVFEVQEKWEKDNELEKNFVSLF